MALSWQELKIELEEETKKLFETCPDEIKRFHYGIINHSDAGKYNHNQYFGHMVHTYGYYGIYSLNMPEIIKQLGADPQFDLEHLKKMYLAIYGSAPFFAKYSGQKLVGKYTEEMKNVIPAIETKEAFFELLGAFQAFMSRLYWWFHWYFPWGAGPAVSRRLSPEDDPKVK
jgi:hypothetical protein